MPVKDRYVAFALNGNNECQHCLDVRMVSKEEQNALKNQAEKFRAKEEEKKLEHENKHKEIKKSLDHYDKVQVIIAKSVYDNFVDRGLIENDDDFQQMWFDFYFNDKELDLTKVPQEFEKILKKVVAL